MNKLSILFLSASLIFLIACNNNDDEADAYGNFEATEILVSAETNGKILHFDIQEGKQYMPGQHIGLIDTMLLYYKKRQLQGRIEALNTKTLNIPSQINVLIEKKNVMDREKRRVENLLREGAATQKQLDDIDGELEIIDKELRASKERLETNNQGILSEIIPIEWQIEEINDQINRSLIINPVKGTVLAKYAENHEIVNYGKPLYQIADITELYLRAYVSGAYLHRIKIGQKVMVFIDEDKDNLKSYEGTISWISDKSEFTPKIVQTKEERVNLVYAIKVRVENDGSIKIGMPGEVKFD